MKFRKCQNVLEKMSYDSELNIFGHFQSNCFLGKKYDCSDTQIFAKKHFFSLRRKFETTVRHRELPGDDLIEIFTSDSKYFEAPSFDEFLYNKDHLKQKCTEASFLLLTLGPRVEFLTFPPKKLMLLRFTNGAGQRKVDKGLKKLIEPIQYWLVAIQFYNKDSLQLLSVYTR